MRKKEYIKKYGKEAYEKMYQRSRGWRETHRKEGKEHARLQRLNNPNEAKANNQEGSRKGGKYYEKRLRYNRTGVQGMRGRVRGGHWRQYYAYKQIIAPESQIHHQWLPNTADYKGVALVEKEQHMHGFIDVIQILEGEITVFTEEEIIKGGIVWI